MFTQDQIRRRFITACGCLVLGIGIGFCDHALMGTDPFTVFLVGLQRHVGFTVGTLNLAVCLLMIVFVLFVDRSKIGIVTFLATVFTSIGIDFVGFLFPNQVSGALMAWLSLIAGELLYVLGTSMAMVPDTGIDPYNAFLTSLQKLTGWTYKTVRWTLEILFLFAGGLLGGIIGIGTVVSLLATAPLVELISPKLKELLNL